MTAFVENQTDLLFADLIQTFPHPEITIKKEDSAAILVRIGGIIKLKLMYYRGAWHMITNDLVLPYTGHFLQKLFLTKASQQLRDQVVSYLTCKFEVRSVHQVIA